MSIIRAHYGAAPRKTYFAGGSSGGREGLIAVSNWPADFDGLIAMFPAWNAVALDLQFGRITRALAQPGAYPNPKKRKRLYDAGIAACDALAIDPSSPERFQSRIVQLNGLQDANKTDLSAFRARGGKILMAHGTADALVSSQATRQYMERLFRTMGKETVSDFVRYCEIPGYAHVVSTAFNAAWDSLTMLENWTERDAPPSNPIVVDTYGVVGRTRPLCDYLSWPRYKGIGDVNAAASFACTTQ